MVPADRKDITVARVPTVKPNSTAIIFKYLFLTPRLHGLTYTNNPPLSLSLSLSSLSLSLSLSKKRRKTCLLNIIYKSLCTPRSVRASIIINTVLLLASVLPVTTLLSIVTYLNTNMLWWTSLLPGVSALTLSTLFGHIHQCHTKHPRCFSALFSVSRHTPTIDSLQQLAS